VAGHAGAAAGVEAHAGSQASLILTSIDEASPRRRAPSQGMSKGEPFDAVIAGNDQMAIAVYRLLTAKGFGIRGRETDRLQQFSFLDYFEKRITTVRSPAFQLRMLGAHHMVRRLGTERSMRSRSSCRSSSSSAKRLTALDVFGRLGTGEQPRNAVRAACRPAVVTIRGETEARCASSRSRKCESAMPCRERKLHRYPARRGQLHSSR
jgi:hypothetical protein